MNQQPHPSSDMVPAAERGFTLIEVMVVIVILGILGTIVAGNVLGQSEEARYRTAEMEVKSLHSEITAFMIQRSPGRIPTWEDLLTPNERGHKWIDLEDPKQDPWDNVYEIVPDDEFPNKPLVISWGPDGIQGTEDDITNKTITRNKEQ